MSAPFTPPANANWQTLLNEITLAYSERRQVLGQSAYMPTDNKDVQAATYWTTLQNWLEINCVSFIDHVNGPLNPAGTDFLYFTVATWRAAAGINAAGFRRVPEGVVWDGVNPPSVGYSYGTMQEGDAIAAVFKEIQAGLGILQNSRVQPTGRLLQRKRASSASESTWALVKTSIESVWATASFIDEWNPIFGGLVFGAYSCGMRAGPDPFNFTAEINVWRIKPIIENVPNFIERSAKIYVYTTAPQLGLTYGVAEGIFDAFGMADVYGGEFAGKLSLCGEVSRTSSSIMTADDWRGYTGTPTWNNEPILNGFWYTRGFTSYSGFDDYTPEDCGAIIKWNFTNA